MTRTFTRLLLLSAVVAVVSPAWASSPYTFTHLQELADKAPAAQGRAMDGNTREHKAVPVHATEGKKTAPKLTEPAEVRHEEYVPEPSRESTEKKTDRATSALAGVLGAGLAVAAFTGGVGAIVAGAAFAIGGVASIWKSSQEDNRAVRGLGIALGAGAVALGVAAMVSPPAAIAVGVIFGIGAILNFAKAIF